MNLVVVALAVAAADADELKIASFEVDVTPPIGAPLCDGLVPPATGVADPLSARGVVLMPGGEQPIVLAAIDWVGIGNEGHDAWRQALADAVHTDIRRVCVHTLHQHDAPGCDFLAEQIAEEFELGGELFLVEFARQSIGRVAHAAAESTERCIAVTHVGFGKAKVAKVASNRRLLGPDGKVQHMRASACSDPAVRALPEGTIDPFTKVLGFWSDDRPAVALTYYATHPQSYYRTGRVSADFVGMARSARESELTGVRHIHFNGAGGNVAAGKYNDGSPENRPVLAARLADGMEAAWQTSRRIPIKDVNIRWKTIDVQLPPASWLDEDTLKTIIADDQLDLRDRLRAARDLAWLRRCRSGHRISLARLRMGPIDILHLPGELFVEYQLAAQQMRPDSLVCTAAYGDYGMGYIGIADAYSQGGYETGRVSRVSPAVETVLTSAIAELLE